MIPLSLIHLQQQHLCSRQYYKGCKASSPKSDWLILVNPFPKFHEKINPLLFKKSCRLREWQKHKAQASHNFSEVIIIFITTVCYQLQSFIIILFGNGADYTAEDNSSFFSLIQICQQPSSRNVGSETLFQQNVPVLDWKCQLTQVDFYNGHKMVVCIFIYSPANDIEAQNIPWWVVCDGGIHSIEFALSMKTRKSSPRPSKKNSFMVRKWDRKSAFLTTSNHSCCNQLWTHRVIL